MIVILGEASRAVSAKVGVNVAKEKEPVRVSSFQRALEQAMGEGREVGNPDDPSNERFPALVQWLTTIYVNRDEMKQPATLTIKATPGGYIVSVNDRDLAIGVDAFINDLSTCLEAIESALNDPNASTRAYANKEPILRKRKRRN